MPDRYPLPPLGDFNSKLSEKKTFSRLDLVRAFQQIPVHPEDIHKTAITTPFGSYEFFRMPFGLRNAAQTFQRFTDQALRGLDFSFVYVDDVLVSSRDEKEHEYHLRQVFERLASYGIKLNTAKCELGVTELQFLGHHVSEKGIRPLDEKVTAIRKFPQPRRQKELRRFLGMVNFYHRFLPNCAEVVRPLSALLKGSKKGVSTMIDWTLKADAAFVAAKQMLADATTLSHPVPDAPLSLAVDASDVSIGGVLQQEVNGQIEPLAFFSRTLQPTQTRYSTFGRELFAMYSAIQQFRHLLEGRDFCAFTDHKPLVNAIRNSSNKHSPRETRHLDFITQFTTDVRHVAGTKNTVADSLSRIASLRVANIDWSAMAEAQASDPEIQALITEPSALNVKGEKFSPDSKMLYYDTSLGKPRPLVPRMFRRQIFDSLHSLSHPCLLYTSPSPRDS